MIAKDRNQSYRKLYFCGGKLDILYRQINEVADEHQAIQFGRGLEILKECPCGCGLKNDVCEAHQVTVKAINDEIPF